MISEIDCFIIKLKKHSYVDLTIEDLNKKPGLMMFSGFLKAFGAVKVSEKNDRIHISLLDKLASDVPRVFFLYLKYGFPIFPKWGNRFRTIPDQLLGIEFLHHMELERIEYSKRAGFKPEVLGEVPVAYAIIKGYSDKKRDDVYLLEFNTDWNRYNLIGGRREPEDGADYRKLIFREIEEELGIPRKEVKLTQLTENPIEGFSLSGNTGVLTRYPCMIFLAHFKNQLKLGLKDKWFTEKEIIELQNTKDIGLIINPAYLDFLFKNCIGKDKKLSYSFEESVEKIPLLQHCLNFITKNKEIIVAILVILGAIIKLMAEF